MLDAPVPEATVRVTPPSLFTDAWAWRLDPKARALASYRTQTRPLRPGLYPVLPESVVNWPYECVVAP
jgi:hypothetical protein